MDANSNKKTDDGRMYFGDKTAAYLTKKSRQAVEKNHNAPILYFAIDWANSKKNFYGEMTMKRFATPGGIPIRGIYQINQNEDTIQQGIPTKTMKLIVSIYTELLQELNVNPQQGDYFGIGKRLYQIYSRTLDDAGPGQLMMGRGQVRKDFYCYEEDDEVIQKNAFGTNSGLEYQINPETNV